MCLALLIPLLQKGNKCFRKQICYGDKQGACALESSRVSQTLRALGNATPIMLDLGLLGLVLGINGAECQGLLWSP